MGCAAAQFIQAGDDGVEALLGGGVIVVADEIMRVAANVAEGHDHGVLVVAAALDGGDLLVILARHPRHDIFRVTEGV